MGNATNAGFDLVLFEIHVFPFPPADIQVTLSVQYIPAVGTGINVTPQLGVNAGFCRRFSDSGQMCACSEIYARARK